MNLRAILMGLAFVLMWSSAFTSARVIVAYAPPMASLALRFLISGGLGVLIALWLGQNFRLTKAQWKATIIFGVCQNALYLGLNFIAMQTVEAGLASIIASSMPLMVGLAGWVVFRERLPRLGVAGLVMGFLGVGLIMGARLEGGVDLYGLGLCRNSGVDQLSRQRKRAIMVHADFCNHITGGRGGHTRLSNDFALTT